MNVHLLKNHKDHFIRLQREIAEAEGLEPDDEAVLDTVEGETDLFFVIERTIRLARENETLAGALGGRIKEMQERKARLLEASGKLRSAVAETMLDIGAKSHKFPEFTLTARTTAPGIEITDEALPAEYKRDKIALVPDREKIDAALEIGADVPGVTRTNGKPSLTVRAK